MLSNDDVDISDIAANIQNALVFKIGWIEEFYSFIGPYLLCVINKFIHEHNIHLENALFERNRVEFDNHNIYLNNKFKNNGPSYTYQNFHIGKFVFAFSV